MIQNFFLVFISDPWEVVNNAQIFTKRDRKPFLTLLGKTICNFFRIYFENHVLNRTMIINSYKCNIYNLLYIIIRKQSFEILYKFQELHNEFSCLSLTSGLEAPVIVLGIPNPLLP